MKERKKLLLKVTKIPGNFFKDGQAWFRLQFNENAGKDKQPLFKGDGCAIWILEEKKKAEEQANVVYEEFAV